MNMSKIFNEHITGFKCPLCGLRKPIDLYEIRCPSCGSFFEIEYDYRALREEVEGWFAPRRMNVWAYKALLPYSTNSVPLSLGEGGTPLVEARHLMSRPILLLKNETTNPTGSFLDRGSTVLVSLLNGVHRVVSCAVNGNLAVSLAAYGAKGGMKVKFYCSPDIERGEFYQAMALGAEIHVTSSQGRAYMEAFEDSDAYYVDSANPFLLEGEKTTIFEILEELSWRAPSWIAVPVGTGGHISMLWKGMKELKSLGLLKGKLPRLIAVQPEAFSPLVDLFDGEAHRRPQGTIARDLVFIEPHKLREAYNAVKESRGLAVRVNDEEMLIAVKDLASKEGVLAEPAAASTIAAIRKLIAEGLIDEDDQVVAIITGSGLKDPEIIRTLISAKSKKHLFITRPKLAILKAMEMMGGRGHGYAIGKFLRNELSLTLSLPTIYHHLREMEGMGLIKRLNILNRRVVLYELTPKALRFLKAHNYEEMNRAS